ncbi:hypothetical protein L6452_07433 [Arctium lappa]|uniref:Uncharacterized protein n=1 Tax=Arctium lappa TaxID=4217 RepID=A0ACB9ELN0_ARCLA|nr:hypothetical protein L6452_07433 [Arctium lappa]
MIQTLDENYHPPQLVSTTDKVRATLVLTRAHINLKKEWLLVQLPKLEFISSFTLGCAFMRSCKAKSRFHHEGKKGENELKKFACVIDWRSRLDLPVLQTYFGNCIGPCFAITKSTILTGNKGFVAAVELVPIVGDASFAWGCLHLSGWTNNDNLRYCFFTSSGDESNSHGSNSFHPLFLLGFPTILTGFAYRVI